MKKIVIAIDGYSSSGKSTMAKKLAAKIGYVYVDSGAMYRAVTLYAMRNGMISADGKVDAARLAKALPLLDIYFERMLDNAQHTFLNGEDVEREIRTIEVSSHVSPVAEIPEVRSALTAMMQRYGKDGGIVMDGRDIGTTVFPDACMKVFVTASPEVRAMRRFRELQEKDSPATYEEVLANIRERDRIDSSRAVSPLRQAPDAVLLDNSNMSLEEQENFLLDLFHKSCAV